jgi:DNA polymerase-4
MTGSDTDHARPPEPGLCRDCSLTLPPARAGAGLERCPRCGSRRIRRHPELADLALAHVDCDAFYATIEKRDNPALAERPVIVGGGERGVVAACCYLARLYGVRSAMPLFKARNLCPDAVIIRPDMKKYQAVGRQVRAMMQALTPLVQPLSIDEAFLDLSGLDPSGLAGSTPAAILAGLARDLERRIGITVSIGLSYNKFLAKLASDLDKPRGFAVIGRAEAPGFLAPWPVSVLWGVGEALRDRLAADGIHTIGDLARRSERTLTARYGVFGTRLWQFARGRDPRAVTPDQPSRSLSAETTFADAIRDRHALARHLEPLCATLASRLNAADLAGGSVVLKLKTADFRLITRSRRLDRPSRIPGRLFATAAVLLDTLADGTRYRLIGIGCQDLVAAAEADRPDLLDALADPNPAPQQRGLGREWS